MHMAEFSTCMNSESGRMVGLIKGYTRVTGAREFEFHSVI